MRTIPLREIIDTKGKHEIGISAYNSYGEGPQAIASVDIAGVPFTVDTEEVSITDVNGNPLTEILSCGQTIVASVNVSNKQLSDEIVIDNVTEFEYVKSDNKKSATITITGIKGDINFIFGELIPVINFNIKYFGSFSTTVNTWEELAAVDSRFIITNGIMQCYGPDENPYNIFRRNNSGSLLTINSTDTIIADTTYETYYDSASSCNFYIRRLNTTTNVGEFTKSYGTMTFANFAESNENFYCDETTAYYIYNEQLYPLTRNNVTMTPSHPITSGYYYINEPIAEGDLIKQLTFVKDGEVLNTQEVKIWEASTWADLYGNKIEWDLKNKIVYNWKNGERNLYVVDANDNYVYSTDKIETGTYYLQDRWVEVTIHESAGGSTAFTVCPDSTWDDIAWNQSWRAEISNDTVYYKTFVGTTSVAIPLQVKDENDNYTAVKPTDVLLSENYYYIDITPYLE